MYHSGMKIMDDIYKAAGIIIKDKKLLLERSKGKEFFIAPGGKIEPGETAPQALIRELKEEFSIVVDMSDIEPFGTFSAEAANQPGQRVHMQVFVVKKWQGEITPDNEVEEIIWLDSVIPSNVRVGSIFGHEVLPRLKAQGLVD
jgi:mutator protein MutT